MIGRREFITLLGGAAAWPVAALAQQPTTRIIGWLSLRSADTSTEKSNLAAFRQGLNQTGYVEGRNLTIEFRFADGNYDRLPALAADLVRRQVEVLMTSGGTNVARVAQAATTTIPIIFATANDPVQDGIVNSINRPSGNSTGTFVLNTALMPKRLELLRQLVPAAVRIAALVDPSNARETETSLRDLGVAARAMGLQIHVVNASTSREINLAFATFVRERPDALFVAPGLFFVQQRVQLTHLASRHAIPAAYSVREYAEAGGLMSYGPNLAEQFYRAATYVDKILRGARPAELPVEQPTTFELVINLHTARAIGLSLRRELLLRADALLE